MRGIEHFRQFHPDCRQIIHVEKAAVINFLGCDPPECEAIRLGVEQFVEPVKAARITWAPVHLGQSFLDRALDLGRFLTTPLQAALYDFFFARALSNFFRINLSAARQIFERSQNTLKLTVKLFVFVFGEIFQRHLENKTVGAGRDRQFLILIGKIERAFFETHLQFTALEHASVLIAQDR